MHVFILYATILQSNLKQFLLFKPTKLDCISECITRSLQIFQSSLISITVYRAMLSYNNQEFWCSYFSTLKALVVIISLPLFQLPIATIAMFKMTRSLLWKKKSEEHLLDHCKDYTSVCQMKLHGCIQSCTSFVQIR